MLRMPRFDVVAPESIADAVDALADGARVVAGGTDLLPNLKHRLEAPARLVSVHRIAALRRIALDEEARELSIGCGVVLAHLARDARVRELYPSLAEAAESVAAPAIRNTATLGGNIHLDTRCRYVNQSELWRSAVGGCLKAGGDVCHVVDKGRRCVAALSSDTVPVLVGLDAHLVLVGPDGERRVPLAEHFVADGVRHTRCARDELATEVRIPLPAGPRRTAYVKWRPRGSIDFPLVSVAIRFDLDADHRVAHARVVAGALAARPREVALPSSIEGRRLDDPALAAEVGEAVFSQCKPLPNVPYDADHRRHLVRVLTERAVRRLGEPQ